MTLEEGERQVFTGRGLPGSRVEAKIGERVLNSTIVGADATWSMAVSSYMIQNDDAVFLTFEQDGQVLENGVSVQIGNSDSGGLSLVMIVLIIIVGIVALGIAVFFFVEVETYDEDVMKLKPPQRPWTPMHGPRRACQCSSASNMVMTSTRLGEPTSGLDLGCGVESVGRRPQLPAIGMTASDG